jgi:hypothetical protein
MKVALLDVGHGNCCVVIDGNEAAVIDIAPGRVAVDFLRRNHVSSVRNVVISHFDKDHCGGFVPLLSSGIRLERVWFSDDQENRTRHYRAIARKLSHARQAGAHVERELAQSGRQFEVGTYTVELLSPHAEDRMLSANRNRMSVMTRIRDGKRGLIFLAADIDMPGYTRLSDEVRDYSADWLVVPHHGGTAGSGAAAVKLLRELVIRTRAKNVFFSIRRVERLLDGSVPKGALPRPELTKLLVAEFPHVNIRCAQLSCHCARVHPWEGRGDFQDVDSEGMHGAHIRSCSGSIILHRDQGFEWQYHAAHSALVNELGLEALCQRSDGQ